MGLRFGRWRKKETTDQRLEREFRANPNDYLGLSGANITAYALNVSGKLSDSERSLPLSRLIATYPPEKWTSRQ